MWWFAGGIPYWQTGYIWKLLVPFTIDCDLNFNNVTFEVYIFHQQKNKQNKKQQQQQQQNTQTTEIV